MVLYQYDIYVIYNVVMETEQGQAWSRFTNDFNILYNDDVYLLLLSLQGLVRAEGLLLLNCLLSLFRCEH